MGKKTDRMYLTMKEWIEHYGGKKVNIHGNGEFIPLAFDCCSISLQPFENPVCTIEGVIFDITNILPWLKKYKIDPITGKSLSAKDLIPLHFHKNDKGKYFCPITYKEFTGYSHIVAIKTSGHVYSYEAIEQLNIKTKNWKCLITDIPFTKQDIITIQDPQNLERRNLSNFHFIKTGMKLHDDDEDPLNNIIISESSKKMLRELNEKHEKKKEEKLKEKKEELSESLTLVNAQSAAFTSSSFSSTHMIVDARDVVKITDKKGYVQLQTNLGNLNFELHCDLAPKTCENFIGLCEKGYYDNTIFHRLVPGFIIQGGDPTGTGKGGQSFWGKPFKDEISQRLQHSARGILSMANSGKDTNKSQFFITFAATPELNFVHTVFGKIVGGHETLNKMEKMRTDYDERPYQDIKIIKTVVFVNPFKEETKEEKEQRKIQELKEKEKRKEEQVIGKWYSNPSGILPNPAKTGVGKYIEEKPKEKEILKLKKEEIISNNDNEKKRIISNILPPVTSKKSKVNEFSNFSNW